MLSSVLRSKRAIQVNIAIMRAFVKLRQILSTHKELGEKLAELEAAVQNHDEKIKVIFEVIRQLMELKPETSPATEKPPVCFIPACSKIFLLDLATSSVYYGEG